jgi:hypothetical protein
MGYVRIVADILFLDQRGIPQICNLPKENRRSVHHKISHALISLVELELPEPVRHMSLLMYQQDVRTASDKCSSPRLFLRLNNGFIPCCQPLPIIQVAVAEKMTFQIKINGSKATAKQLDSGVC